jgi:hypothetical protein
MHLIKGFSDSYTALFKLYLHPRVIHSPKSLHRSGSLPNQLTTGSGKTLTSFKAARLATELDFVDKVFFVVDRFY